MLFFQLVIKIKLMNKIYIGVSGVAGAGKDLFTRLLIEKLGNNNAKRYALADFLKEKLKNPIKQIFNIDSTNCNKEEKDIIRNCLVFHGNLMRDITNGRYWVEHLQEIIDNDDFTGKFAIISDVRYNFYPRDEVFWIQKENNGVVVHLSKYNLREKIVFNGIGDFNRFIETTYSRPANSTEENHDPLVRSAANYKLEWEEKSDKSIAHLYKHIDDFVEFLNKKYNL